MLDIYELTSLVDTTFSVFIGTGLSDDCDEGIQGIFPGFSIYSKIRCYKLFELIKISDSKWKQEFVVTSFFGEEKVAPVSVGNENAWNSFCIQVNGTAAMIKLNGRNLISQEDSFNRTSFWDVTTLSKFNSTRFWDITTQSKVNETVFWNLTSQSNFKTSFPFQPNKGGVI